MRSALRFDPSRLSRLVAYSSFLEGRGEAWVGSASNVDFLTLTKEPTRAYAAARVHCERLSLIFVDAQACFTWMDLLFAISIVFFKA